MINVYPAAKQIPAHPSNYRTCSPKRTTFNLVVIHCTDGGPKAEYTAEMFATAKLDRDPPRATSAHFVIGQDGTVIQCVDLGDVAYHASECNSISVGVEHCARTPMELSHTDPGIPFSDAQYAASAKLTAWLCLTAGLPIDRDHIKGHNEASPKDRHDDCPTGPGFNWDRYLELVREAFTLWHPHAQVDEDRS